MTVLVIDGPFIQDVQQRAASAWQDQIPEKLPEGWSISPVDFGPFVAVFAPLRLKAGLVLRAYQFSMYRNAEALVFAIPEDVPVSAPRHSAEEVDPPVEALDDLMLAIEGDGSPRSYFLASLFAREIAEVGARGHGSIWISSHIQDGDPWRDGQSHADPSPDQPRPTGDGKDWEWFDSAPEQWSPTVEVNDQGVTVTFYTYDALSTETLSRITDTYPATGYQFSTDTQVIARGGKGYIW